MAKAHRRIGIRVYKRANRKTAASRFAPTLFEETWREVRYQGDSSLHAAT